MELLMKKELAEKWACALESGEYQQCTGALENSGKYCCLGVLLSVHPDYTFDNAGCFTCPVEFGTAYEEGDLSNRTLERVGMSNTDEREFIDMNDMQSLSFKEIAAKVREKYCG
jgi:hypothetical protein